MVLPVRAPLQMREEKQADDLSPPALPQDSTEAGREGVRLPEAGRIPTQAKQLW